MIFHCCELRRLEILRRSSTDTNAIEFLEVLDHAAPPGVEPQRTLFVRLLRTPPAPLDVGNVEITGGERIPTVGIEWVAMADNLPATAEPGLVDGVEELPRTLVIRTTSSGDFSRYTLRLVASPGSHEPPDKFDPLLSSIEFSFKVECPTDFDCAAPLPCAPAPVDTPRIDYLAKDYEGFRRLMLDRLSLLTPGWTERSAADAGVALVELLAYAADNLSYRQDVIANEAYLNTARQRISVRRHARLVDYLLARGLQRAGVRTLSSRGKHFAHAGGPRAAADQGARNRRREDRAGLRGRTRRASCSRAGVRDRARAVIAATRSTSSSSTPGATRNAACRAVRPPPRSRDRPKDLVRGDFLVS